MRIPLLQNVDLPVVKTFLDYQYVQGLDSIYNMVKLEDAIVYRINLAENVFNDIMDFNEAMTYRDVQLLELLFTGVIPINNFNITRYYNSNTKFRNYINELYHVKFTTAPSNASFYYVIVNDIHTRFLKYKSLLSNSMMGSFTFIGLSCMQSYYYSYTCVVNDVIIPSPFYKEVLTVA